MTEQLKEDGGQEEKKNGLSGLFKGKDGLLRLIVLAGVAGIGLIFFSSFFSRTPQTEKPAASASAGTEQFSLEDYRRELTDEMGNMIACIKGAGKTRIMLTVDGTVRNLYASDNDIQQRESSRRTGGDENADRQQNEKQSVITVRNKDGSQQAITVGQQMPRIRGVLVVCEGGDDPEVCEKIREAVASALSISKTHVSVLKGNF